MRTTLCQDEHVRNAQMVQSLSEILGVENGEKWTAPQVRREIKGEFTSLRRFREHPLSRHAIRVQAILRHPDEPGKKWQLQAVEGMLEAVRSDCEVSKKKGSR